MKTLNYIVGCLCLLSMGLWGCMDDLGNYDYDFDGVPELKIDTAGVDRTPIWTNWNIGDTIRFFPKVKYNKPENLTYAYFVLPNPYQTMTVGNAQVYPPADTICRTLNLDYVVNLEAGKAYTLYLMVKDSVLGTSTSMNLRNYLNIPEAGKLAGFYCLQEKDGYIDIDIFGTANQMIYNYNGSTDFHVKNYWSTMHPDAPLEGKARMIYYSSSYSTGNYYYIFTDKGGFRCSPNNLIIMDNWDEMFYDAPSYNPQAIQTLNECDYLINNGKLHCLKRDLVDRKFAAPINGDYQLAPFLASSVYTSNASKISAAQIIFDTKQNGFRPFFNKASSLSRFNESDPTAAFDVNNMDGEFIYASTVRDNETMVVMKQKDGYWMNVASFYNVEDNGKLAHHSYSLSSCTDIDKATLFASFKTTSALFYAVKNTLYSYSYATGSFNQLWTGEAGDEITCICFWPPFGGPPTQGKMFYAAVWNENTKQGKVLEFEFNVTSGAIEDINNFDPEGRKSPRIIEGFGKVISMTPTL